MKLVYIVILVIVITSSLTGKEKNKRLLPVETKLLFSYYNQDGDHSAVTGGRGTEELSDYSASVVVHIPLDSSHAISADVGIDYYTSASTDKIDFEKSSASRKDNRTHIKAGYSYSNKNATFKFGIDGAFAVESDYLSRGFHGWFETSDAFHNKTIRFKTGVYLDHVGWGFLKPGVFSFEEFVYPAELRGTEWFTKNNRNTYSISLSYLQVINQHLKAGLFTDLVFQKGLLSTTFHRVYFQDQIAPKVENLPEMRTKFPIGLRVNYFPVSRFLIRSYYRFYNDDFGITAHTASLEIGYKLSSFSSIYPFYRIYTQSSSNYFAPYGRHSVKQEYYASDYDFSAFNSHKIGLGVKFSPLFGIYSFTNEFTSRKRMLQTIDFRIGRYMRSEGLRAWFVSLVFNYSDY